MAKKEEVSGHKVVATNRKAYHDYELIEQFEAGLVLTGSEVKSLRDGRCSLRDGFVHERSHELWLMEVNIPEYFQSGMFGHEALRERKLLMHRKEIEKLLAKVRERGYTIIPLQMYFKNGRAKVEVALARGRKAYDKRTEMSEKDSRRDIERALKEHDRES